MEIPAASNADGIVIHVRLTPKSGAARIAGAALHGGKLVLKAHVTAPPEDGKANAAATALIAGWLGVPKSKVSVASGQKSRLKTVAVAGDPVELIARVRLLLVERDESK
ncbi:MAG: DUF167 family protein [Rhodomicrobium sp.]